MRTCCFGLTLRTGCISVGIINLVQDENTLCVVAMVLITLVFIPTNIILLMGTSDKKPPLLLLWLLIYTLTWLAELVYVIYKLAQGFIKYNKIPVLLGLLVIALTFYMLVVVYSHCKELKKEETELRKSYSLQRKTTPAANLHRRVSTNSIRLKPVIKEYKTSISVSSEEAVV
uniref:Uncharacterized protein n=1 Tax=Timema genevievae TaxID=629358 RepID=A0A7R9K1R1_TIMGE|nr:unnamed protein product [Timema genevievae]